MIHRPNLRRSLFPVFLSFVLWSVWAHPSLAAATERWVVISAPAMNPDLTQNDGRDEGHAAPFSVPLVNSWLQDAQLDDLTITFIAPEPDFGIDVESASFPNYHFKIQGTAGNERLAITQGALPRKIRLVGKKNSADQRPVLRLVKTAYDLGWGSSETLHDWMVKSFPEVRKPGAAYLEHFEMKDMILDGDFENQGPYASAAHWGGYKGAALWVFSRTGLLDNLLVRRFGVVGRLPQSYFGPAEGTETFVVQFYTKAGDKYATDWNPPPPENPRSFPWEVRRVNIEEFTSLNAGYTTLMMPMAFYNDNEVPSNLSFSDPPVIAIRQCQIIGNQDTIGLGTAGTVDGSLRTRRIAYQDNVILNCATAVNTDTGDVSLLNIRRNAFMDFLHGIRQGPSQHDYRIEDNLFRLRGRAYLPNYRNFNWVPAPGTTVTDPNLILGRNYLPPCNVLMWDGGIQQMEFRNNWITTWPSNQELFQLPVLGPVASAYLKYRPIWTMPSGFIDEVWGSQTRSPSLQITLKDNHISPAAMEFRSGSVTPAPLNSVSLALSSPASGGYTYSSAYQDERSPALLDPAIALQFVPRSMVNRLHPNFFVDDDLDPDNDDYEKGQLVSVTEVTLGDCQLAVVGTELTVTAKARVLDHVLPRTVGTQIVAAASVPSEVSPIVMFKIAVLVDGQAVPAVSGYVVSGDLNTSTGIATGSLKFHVTPGPFPSHGVVRVTAYSYTGFNGEAALNIYNATLTEMGTYLDKLEQNHDAWASMEMKFGQVVEVTANPDVGDDKNTTLDKRAKFVVRRNGTTGDLPVRVKVVSSGLTRPTPAGGGSLDATYGTSGSADYYFSGGLASGDSWTGYAVGQTKTVVIPDTADSVTISVVTRADNLTENNVIVLEVVPDSNTSAPNYSVGTKSRARVLLYDGPEFTLVPLEAGPPPTYTYASSAVAINDGVKNSNGTFAVLPQITGSATWLLGGVVENRGVVWEAGTSSPGLNLGAGFVPAGITLKSSANGQYVVAGSNSTDARRIVITGTAFTSFLLPPIPAGTSPSAALGIAPAGYYAAGYGKLGSKRHPTVWGGLDAPLDLLGVTYPDADGEAKGVNDSKVAVGSVTGRYTTSTSTKRGFRTPGGTLVELANADDLPPPESVTSDKETSSVSVNASGQAVGTYKYSLADDSAAFWAARSGNVNASASDLGRWKSPVNSTTYDTRSFALAINNQGRIVGRSRSAAGIDRAVLRYSYIDPWKDLNDRHFVHGTTGWVLQSATAINNTGYIVGNGTLNGASRGFVLIPRTPGN